MAKLFSTMIDRISVGFELLSEREKKLTLALLGAFALIIFGGGTFWIFNAGMEKRGQIESLERQISEIETLKIKYAAAKVEQQRDEKRYRENRVSLFTLLQA